MKKRQGENEDRHEGDQEVEEVFIQKSHSALYLHV
jgi:hypothetical protein